MFCGILFKNTMELKLKRPICFFDLETTGVNVVKDRIVEIGILKIFPNGNKESKTWLVNPERSIPFNITRLTGIDEYGEPVIVSVRLTDVST